MVKVLVVGSGGREHALVWALAQSPQVDEIHVAPGNGGTVGLATQVAIAADDVSGLVRYAQQQTFDLVVVGPEIPLALGLTDALAAQGMAVFGPIQAAARIEASKAFSKNFMRDNGMPTAEYALFTEHEAALAYLAEHPAPIVVKASGLAAGKGAIVCQTDQEAREALDLIMVQRAFGAAGDEVVIEACLSGQEVSVLAFCDGKVAVPMILAQDHKPAYDSDRGPNTGGMGCYAPAPLLDQAMLARVQQQVLQRTVDAMAAAGTPYVGVLYAGLMVSGDDYQVLEFNCRFGDPETQVILPLLETDLYEIMVACVQGCLSQLDLHWVNKVAVCVVMAAGGYPGTYAKGQPISGLEQVACLKDTVVFHAGTQCDDQGQIVTAGGRVLGVTAWSDTLADAIDKAYEATGMISWQDVQFRTDIGAKGLVSAGKTS